MLCKEWTAVHRAIDHVRALPLECRCWNCPLCYEKRRRELIAQLLDGQPDMFLTITLRRSVAKTPELARKRLAHEWAKLAKSIARYHGVKSFAYAVICEKHKSGWPHFHILARLPYTNWHWLKRKMKKQANSPSVDVRRIKRKAQIAYCAKYAGKAVERFGTSKRYFFSKLYGIAWVSRAKRRADRPRQKWTIETTNLEGVLIDYPWHLYTRQWDGNALIINRRR